MTGTLRISQLAERSGFRPSALRYYEQVGLLPVAERTPAGYRLYDESAVARLQFVDRAKRLGLPLEEIRELVAVWDGGLCAHLQDQLAEHITAKSREVRVRIRELTGFAEQLEAARAQLAGPAPAGGCGPGCGCADGPGVPAGQARTPEVVPLMRRRPDRDPSSGFGAPAGSRADAVPVACTLDAADRPSRMAAWDELLAQVTERERLDAGIRLTFPPDPMLAGRLGELAVREQACCAFLTFALRPGTAGVILEITTADDATGVVLEMFGGD